MIILILMLLYQSMISQILPDSVIMIHTGQDRPLKKTTDFFVHLKGLLGNID